MLAEDIKTKTFKSKLKGFDKEEVQAYLKEVAEQMNQMDASNQYVQQQLYEANQVIDEFREKEATLNRSIVVAQQAADRLKSEAIAEANDIVARAQATGQQILQTSAEQATRIKQETESLKDVSRTYIHQMKALIESAKTTLEDERWEKLFQDQPVDPVDTPALDSVLNGDALPISDGKAEAIYQQHFEAQDKAKKQEQMFEDNEQRYQVRLSRQPIPQSNDVAEDDGEFETPQATTEDTTASAATDNDTIAETQASRPEETLTSEPDEALSMDEKTADETKHTVLAPPTSESTQNPEE